MMSQIYPLVIIFTIFVLQETILDDARTAYTKFRENLDRVSAKGTCPDVAVLKTCKGVLMKQTEALRLLKQSTEDEHHGSILDAEAEIKGMNPDSLVN